MEDGVDFTFDEPNAPALVLGKKKKKKNLGSEAPALDGVGDTGEPIREALGGLSLSETKKKKKKKKRGETTKAAENDCDSALDVDFVEDRKQKSTSVGLFSSFDELGDGGDAHSCDDDADHRGPVEGDEGAHVSTGKAPGKKKKGKKKSERALAESEGDVDAILAELDASSATSAPHGLGADMAEAPARVSKSSKRNKKKGTNVLDSSKATDDGDDIDALLATLDAPAASVSEVPSLDGGVSVAASAPRGSDTCRNTNDGGVEEDDDLAAMLAEPVTDGGGGSSLGAKKKKKKAKKTAPKSEILDDASGPMGRIAEPPVGKKGGRKESSAVKRLREAQERKAAEEARLAQLRAEEDAARLEEERKEREQAEARERARQAKKEAEKVRKARLKAEGKLLSKAEAAKKRKAEAFRQQALASGLVPAAAETSSAGKDGVLSTERGAVSGESGKVVYGKKKKGKAKNDEACLTPVTNSAVHYETQVDLPTKDSVEPTVTPSEDEVPDEWDAEPDATRSVLDDGQVPGGPLGSETKDKDTVCSGLPELSEEKEQEKTTRAKGDELLGGEESDFEDEGGVNQSDDSDLGSCTCSDSSIDKDGMTPAGVAALNRQRIIRKTRAEEVIEAKAARSPDDLRSPIVCILGHVDTGKTKILDRIRRTNVQDGEAGGITQQIGASYFPIEAVKKETCKLEEGRAMMYRVPSLLIIDTPGHESFTNLRSRGSSLCDIAILVVDIMHGLEQQTRESIELLKQRKCPFVVLLNKVDRMYDWEEQKGNNPVRHSLSVQKRHVFEEFSRRTKEIQVEFQSVGFNTALYWENDDVRRNISLIPTSAITGEGIPDLLMIILSLSQKLLVDRLMYCAILEATVLEVKVIEGLGTTIDIVLTGGIIHAGDTIFVVGLDGVIQTSIRALLTPHPMKEMRVKGQYLHHKQIRAAQGIKISADGLDKAVAGTQLLVARNSNDADEVAYLRDEVMKDFETILRNVDKSGEGVYVQASTLGSLEALLEFLRTSDIPVSGINIGPVHKKDVHRASAMLEKRKEYATILAFDVPVEKEARDLAEEVDVTIFTADIIYNLFDMFTEHMDLHKKQRQEDIKDDVVFPCILKIKPDCVFNKKDPIILGVDVAEGILRVGCPLAVRSNDQWLDIGRVVSLEVNMKSVVTCSAGETVCVKIQSPKTAHVTYGRHLTWTDQLVSKMSRKSIDILKSDFRNDLGKLEWMLVVKLKKMFAII